MENNFSKENYSALISSLSARYPSFGAVGAAAYKPGLERMLHICSVLGNPQNAYPCIHVAGTNGKGSTCNMLAAHYASKGLKVGLYTSPHILDFRERSRVVSADGWRLVDERFVWDFLTAREDEFRAEGLSYFEITTALAFAFFAAQKVDIAIIETGLGGRLDATNVVMPQLSIITNIGLDHMDILGDIVEKIAAEKAGIMKPGVPALVGEWDEATAPVFEARAAQLGCELHFGDRGEPACDLGISAAELDLRGSYQRKNLRTVISALGLLGEKPRPEALRHAASICGFGGRWEQVCSDPLTICDIGHNAHGLKYNFSQLEAMLSSGEISDLVMVYGSVSDKDVDAVVRMLPSRAFIYFTAAASPRALGAEALMEKAVRFGRGCGIAVPDVREAVTLAKERCKGLSKPLLYIGGSTYVVAEALPLFR